MKNGLHVDKKGSKKWYKDDELHNLDGPAIVHPNGIKMWYKEGKLHRLDGSAVEGVTDYVDFKIEGRRYHYKEEWEADAIKHKMKEMLES